MAKSRRKTKPTQTKSREAKPKDNGIDKRYVAVGMIIVTLIVLYILREANALPIILRIVLALGMLVLVGIAVQRMLKLQGGYGLYMIGSKHGLATIEKTAKVHDVFWEVMAMWGLTLGFGVLTYPLLKGKIDKRVYAFGLISLVLIMIFVLPNLGNALQFINIPQVQNAVASRSASTGTSTSLPLTSYLVYAVTFVAGFTGTIITSLFVSTEYIFWSIIQFATAPSAAAAKTVTNNIGVAPIIPGITIPFLAGIISLIILLSIHEFSHGVLAKKAKVKLKSIGVLMFGAVPVGGFVEPDEKQVDKLPKMQQTKIFAAGVSANFIATIVFFALMMLMMAYVLPSIYQYRIVITGILPNYPANGVLQDGMQILKWNNNTITNITTLDAAGSKDLPNSTVTVVTNKGTYSMKATASPTNSSRGLIGVSLGYGYVPIKPSPFSGFMYFLYTLFSLSMLLNFFVGVLNLLPLPGLDGWRIYFANIKSERLIKTLGALIIILIIINILPVIFYL